MLIDDATLFVHHDLARGFGLL